MRRIAVLCSGGGTNLQALIDAQGSVLNSGKIALVIAKEGNIPERDMFNTYNMGVGMSIVVPAAEVEKSLEILSANGETAYVIGEIIESDEKVIL